MIEDTLLALLVGFAFGWIAARTQAEDDENLESDRKWNHPK